MTYFDFTDFNKGPLKLFSTGSTINSSTSSSLYVNNGLEKSPVYIPAAGFSKSDISVEVKSGTFLKIIGKTEKFGEKHLNLMYTLPENINLDSIEVTVADGMITITFENKGEETKTIKVK